jgi:ribosomal protein S18 acetylase RimI-like enzyme
MGDAVRAATEADRAAVERIVYEAYAPWVERIGMRPAPMDADYAALIAEGRVHVTGSAEVDGLIVLIPEDGALLVENVAVRSRLHGQGIGRRLLAFAEEQARARGVPALRLYTNAKMTRNIALYESLGYAETERKTIPGGGQIVLMRKRLEATH